MDTSRRPIRCIYRPGTRYTLSTAALDGDGTLTQNCNIPAGVPRTEERIVARIRSFALEHNVGEIVLEGPFPGWPRATIELIQMPSWHHEPRVSGVAVYAEEERARCLASILTRTVDAVVIVSRSHTTEDVFDPLLAYCPPRAAFRDGMPPPLVVHAAATWHGMSADAAHAELRSRLLRAMANAAIRDSIPPFDLYAFGGALHASITRPRASYTSFYSVFPVDSASVEQPAVRDLLATLFMGAALERREAHARVFDSPRPPLVSGVIGLMGALVEHTYTKTNVAAKIKEAVTECVQRFTSRPKWHQQPVHVQLVRLANAFLIRAEAIFETIVTDFYATFKSTMFTLDKIKDVTDDDGNSLTLAFLEYALPRALSSPKARVPLSRLIHTSDGPLPTERRDTEAMTDEHVTYFVEPLADAFAAAIDAAFLQLREVAHECSDETSALAAAGPLLLPIPPAMPVASLLLSTPAPSPWYSPELATNTRHGDVPGVVDLFLLDSRSDDDELAKDMHTSLLVVEYTPTDRGTIQACVHATNLGELERACRGSTLVFFDDMRYSRAETGTGLPDDDHVVRILITSKRSESFAERARQHAHVLLVPDSMEPILVLEIQRCLALRLSAVGMWDVAPDVDECNTHPLAFQLWLPLVQAYVDVPMAVAMSMCQTIGLANKAIVTPVGAWMQRGMGPMETTAETLKRKRAGDHVCDCCIAFYPHYTLKRTPVLVEESMLSRSKEEEEAWKKREQERLLLLLQQDKNAKKKRVLNYIIKQDNKPPCAGGHKTDNFRILTGGYVALKCVCADD